MAVQQHLAAYLVYIQTRYFVFVSGALNEKASTALPDPFKFCDQIVNCHLSIRLYETSVAGSVAHIGVRVKCATQIQTQELAAVIGMNRSPLTGPHDTDPTVLMTTGEKPTIQLPRSAASGSEWSPRNKYLAMSGVFLLLVGGVISRAIYYPSASGPVPSTAAVQPPPSATSTPEGEPAWTPLTQVSNNNIKVSYAVVGKTFKLKFINNEEADAKIKYRLTCQTFVKNVWKPFEWDYEVAVKKGRHAFDNFPMLDAEDVRDVAVEITDWEYY